MTKQGVLSWWQRVKSQDVHESSEKGGVNQWPHIKNCDCKIICQTLGGQGLYGVNLLSCVMSLWVSVRNVLWPAASTGSTQRWKIVFSVSQLYYFCYFFILFPRSLWNNAQFMFIFLLCTHKHDNNHNRLLIALICSLWILHNVEPLMVLWVLRLIYLCVSKMQSKHFWSCTALRAVLHCSQFSEAMSQKSLSARGWILNPAALVCA